MLGAAFKKNRYANFSQFIEAVRMWIHGDGAASVQLCGCTTSHSYGSPWISFKADHFDDGRWNGTYVVNADTKREALIELLELVDTGKTTREILTAGMTTGGTRTIRVLGRTQAEGFYVYQHKTGIPLDIETQQCRGRATQKQR